MRELEVLGTGHLKLDFADCQEFFEQELAELVRSQLKLLIEQALVAEQDRYLELGYYEHAPASRFDYRNGCYFRDLPSSMSFRINGIRNVNSVSPLV
jgi:transposase-like protein